MTFSLPQVVALLNDHHLNATHHGDNIEFNTMSAATSVAADTLVCCDDRSLIDKVIASSPAAVITNHEIAHMLNQSLPIVVCDDVGLAHALIRLTFFDHHFDGCFTPGIHPTAVVDDTAAIAADVSIGARTVIAANVHIGHHSQIAANCIIDNDCQIGEHCRVFANTTIGPHTQIGNRVIVKMGSTIGGEGFGFVADKKNSHHRLPHQGRVSIADDVVIGAGCNLDCATYGETRIGNGTKLDALCHIAHNVIVGENCLILAQTVIGGSSTIGDRVVISGQAAISDHKIVGSDITLVHRAGVMQDLGEPGVYASTPAQPIKNYLRNISIFQKLFELRSRVARLEKRLKSNSE